MTACLHVQFIYVREIILDSLKDKSVFFVELKILSTNGLPVISDLVMPEEFRSSLTIVKTNLIHLFWFILFCKKLY